MASLRWTGALMRGLLQSVARMFATLREERRDLMIPICTATLLGIFADPLLLGLIGRISPAAAMAFAAWHPAWRPALLGLCCSGGFLCFCFRPYWLAARRHGGRGP